MKQQTISWPDPEKKKVNKIRKKKKQPQIWRNLKQS